LSRKNRTHNNRRVLALGEHRIFYSHRKFGRHSTASVQWPRVRSAASDDGIKIMRGLLLDGPGRREAVKIQLNSLGDQCR